MDEIIKKQICFKIDEIDKLFIEYDSIFKKIDEKEPDLYDVTILASVLHSFYNGLENIFKIIAKNIDNNVPSGNKSHQELLEQMATKNKYRNAIIDKKIYLSLREYATFRHFYRHSYSYQISWNKMKYLIDDIFDIWSDFKISIQNILR